MEFYFVRHGESEANKNGVIAGGSYDPPLTDLGRQQAMAAQEHVHNLNFHRIYHSPMIRAHDTAKIVNEKKQAPMNLTDDLREWNLGNWVDITYAELTDRVVNQGLIPENGEAYEDFCDRIEQAVRSILDQEKVPFMIVAHAGTFAALTKRFNLEHNFKPVKNCAVLHCKYTQDGWRVSQVSP